MFQFNFTRYTDDVLSINNLNIKKYLGHLYPTEHEIKAMTWSDTPASYFDLLLPNGLDN